MKFENSSFFASTAVSTKRNYDHDSLNDYTFGTSLTTTSIDCPLTSPPAVSSFLKKQHHRSRLSRTFPAVNLELPSIIQQFQPRGLDDTFWANTEAAARNDYAPSVSFPSKSSSASDVSSPRGTSFSNSSVVPGSAASLTSYSSGGSFRSREDSPRARPPTSDNRVLQQYPTNNYQYHPYLQQRDMSMTQGYGSVQPHHGYASSHHQQQPMATPLAHTPTSVSSYSSHYQHPVALLQPSINSYSPNYTHFPHSYGTPVTSPPSAGAHGHGHGHYAQPTITLPAPNTAPVENPGVTDATGQSAPPGMKPKVTATLWEDEGTLCFQVEARGICVARREDNHMINGTKLLNVAQMTRGRRDGILKSEKLRNVIKIGPMHLKGVW